MRARWRTVSVWLTAMAGCIDPEPVVKTESDAVDTAGTGGDTPTPGKNPPINTDAAGSGSAGTPSTSAPSAGSSSPPPPPVAGSPAPVCVKEIAGAPCSLITGCGCDEGLACYVESAEGANAKVGCHAEGSTSAGSLCNDNQDCISGHACVGPDDGAICRAVCLSDQDCGAGVCDSVQNKSGGTSVAITGYRTCFETCATHTDCATGCCGRSVSGQQVCAATALCEPTVVPDGQPCTDDTMCEADSLCIDTDDGRLCVGKCTTNAGCKSGCCAETSQGNRVCGPPKYCEAPPTPPPMACFATGVTCESNGDCCLFATGEGACVSFGTETRCGAFCTSNSQCQSNCCHPLEGGQSACLPAEECQ